MDTFGTAAPPPQNPEALLARLQYEFNRHTPPRLQTSLTAKPSTISQTAGSANTAAPHVSRSEGPVNLELLSDGTAQLFGDFERLLTHSRKAAPQSTHAAALLLLQRIRTAVNRELRESLSFIENGYQSAFEQLLHEGRVTERHGAQSKSPLPSAEPSRVRDATTAATAATTAMQQQQQPSFPLQRALGNDTDTGTLSTTSVRDALSESLSLMAESLAVLLQCEVVRIFLYDAHDNLQCAAQFPYRASAADPMQSDSLALLAVREVHRAVCQEHLAVNGALDRPKTSESRAQSTGMKRQSVLAASSPHAAGGAEAIRTCLMFPVVSPQGAGKSYGMIHAVNKRFPAMLAASDRTDTDRALRGFSGADELLVCNAARLLGTTLSRYPSHCFTATNVGEQIRRHACPGETTLLSLYAHLPPYLHDAIPEAAAAGQEALSFTPPALVYRAPAHAVYAARGLQDASRRKVTSAGDAETAVTAVELRLRCLEELWQSSRDDNIALHKQYRVLEEEAQATKRLLLNVLDGVAAARGMRLPPEVGQYLQRLEVYGHSGQTDRIAAYVSDTLQALSLGNQPQPAAEVVAAPATATPTDAALTGADVTQLRHRHENVNTVTAASLHYDGPDGVGTYTSDPVKRREQVRFIDELCRRKPQNATQPLPSHAAVNRRAMKASGGRGGASNAGTFSSSSRAPLPRLAAHMNIAATSTHPFQRPFKLQ